MQFICYFINDYYRTTKILCRSVYEIMNEVIITKISISIKIYLTSFYVAHSACTTRNTLHDAFFKCIVSSLVTNENLERKYSTVTFKFFPRINR